MGRIVLRGLGFIYCWGEGHVDRLLGMVGYSWFKRIGYLVVVGGGVVVQNGVGGAQVKKWAVMI